MVSTNSIDLGRIYNFSASTNTFQLVNSGSTDIAVLDAVSTCPCMSAEKVERIIKPGEKHTVVTYFNPRAVFGKFKRGVWLITDDPAQKRTLLTLSGEVLPLFDGIPADEIVLQSADTSTLFTNTFTFTATTTNYFLDNPTHNNSLLDITTHMEKVKDKPGTFKLTIISQSKKAARMTAYVNLPVTGPARVDDIRIKFKFIIGSQLRASPSRLIVADLNETMTKGFFINTSTSEAKPESLTWEPQIEGLGITTEEYVQSSKSQSRVFPKRASSASSNRSVRYKCMVSISPDALKKLMEMNEPAITFNYPDHKPVKIPLIAVKEKTPPPAEAAAQ